LQQEKRKGFSKIKANKTTMTQNQFKHFIIFFSDWVSFEEQK